MQTWCYMKCKHLQHFYSKFLACNSRHGAFAALYLNLRHMSDINNNNNNAQPTVLAQRSNVSRSIFNKIIQQHLHLTWWPLLGFGTDVITLSSDSSDISASSCIDIRSAAKKDTEISTRMVMGILFRWHIFSTAPWISPVQKCILLNVTFMDCWNTDLQARHKINKLSKQWRQNHLEAWN